MARASHRSGILVVDDHRREGLTVHLTSTHSQRVSRLCLQMAGFLGTNPEDWWLLRTAALLHDVGKMAVPTAILTKAGPLTPEERAMMNAHPARGAEILDRTTHLREAAGIVRHHHERPDGSGYPDRLRGEAIPSLARLIAVADAYDAMTTERPYRRPVTPQAAMRELFRHAGTQFDPEAVVAMGRVAAGLGAAHDRRFVEMHGGKVWPGSEPGRGSRFGFTLPLASGTYHT